MIDELKITESHTVQFFSTLTLSKRIEFSTIAPSSIVTWELI